MITKTVEGLIIQRNEIFSVVLNYMENAYKYTKYKIAIKSSENGVVAGEGEYLQFHEDRIFPQRNKKWSPPQRTKMIKSTGKPAEKAMTERLKPDVSRAMPHADLYKKN